MHGEVFVDYLCSREKCVNKIQKKVDGIIVPDNNIL